MKKYFYMLLFLNGCLLHGMQDPLVLAICTKDVVRARSILDPLIQAVRDAAASSSMSSIADQLQKLKERLNRRDSVGLTMLHRASLANSVELVCLLLDAGAESEIISRSEEKPMGSTPLAWAAAYDHKEVVDELLKHKANPNAGAGELMTPLMEATSHGNIEVMCALIDAGADVNGDGLGNSTTPLHMAASEGHLEAARILLKHGAKASMNKTQKHSCLTPVHRAAEYRDPEIAIAMVTLLRRYA